MRGNCLTDEQLAVLLEGQLQQTETIALHQHLADCPDCMALLGALGASLDDKPAARTWDRLQAVDGASDLPPSFAEFRLLRLVGKGAMGAVYLAEDTLLRRQVAIKFIQTPSTVGAARFQQEARAVARLAHSNIVALYKVGEVMGIPYQVSEYVAGQTLAELALPLAEREVLSIARELVAGLAEAHRHGIVHRDIKPHNIMRTTSGHVKLLDFGLAKLLDDLAEGPETRDGAIIGTPRYMAPETLRGARGTPQSDVYSVGVVLHELLLGALPSAEIPERPPVEISVDLWALLRRCLAADPARRPIDAGALHDLLLALHTTPRRSVSRSRVVVGISIAIAFLASGLSLRYWQRSATPEIAAPAIPGMVRFAGGSFSMGLSPTEIDEECRSAGQDCFRERMEREQPRRTITLTPFYLDRHEVTNAELASWLQILAPSVVVKDDEDTHLPRYVYERTDGLPNQSALLLFDLGPQQNSIQYDAQHGYTVRAGHEQLPVVRITWDGARRYCSARGKRLPTEAEWELAARGKKGRRFPWGDAAPRCDGVSFGREKGLPCATQPLAPSPVGTSTQDVTPDGVMDLGGNVAEWVEDAFTLPHYPDCGTCRDPAQTSTVAIAEDMRLLRGGAFSAEWTLCRATGRGRWQRTGAMTGLGFRCAAR